MYILCFNILIYRYVLVYRSIRICIGYILLQKQKFIVPYTYDDVFIKQIK